MRSTAQVSGRNDEHAWQSRDELAATLGIRHTAVDRLRKELPATAQRRVGKRVEIHAPTATRTWAKIAAAGPSRREVLPEPPEEQGAQGGDSPALERKRAAEAEIKEIELAQLRGELVRVDEIRELFGLLATSARACAEQLGRLYGDGARDDFNAWLARLAEDVTRIAGEAEA